MKAWIIGAVLVAFLLWLIWHSHLILRGPTLVGGLVVVGVVIWLATKLSDRRRL